MDNQDHSETQDANSPGFVAPRHWIGAEELEPSYWADPKVREKRGQEFFEKPLEFVDQVDRVDKKGVIRREFLTIMGASMAMASFSCARRPVHKIIPYVVQPEELTPGVASWYASTCTDCSAQCGVLVKTRESRPIKLEGNPDHPLNRGALCAKGQASVLNLYDPDRLKTPLVRSRLGGAPQEASWKDIDARVLSKLNNTASVCVLTGSVHSPSTRNLIQEFVGSFTRGRHVEYEPLHFEEIAEAQSLAYGSAIIPQYRFDQADVVLSLGADFLENWLSPMEHSRSWSKGRKLEGQKAAHAKLSKLICFEPTLSVTGANADERYPVRPGDELKIGLALAHEIVVSRKLSRFSADAQVTSALMSYSPEKVANEIGLEGGAPVLKKIADLLWQSRGKSLVVGGSLQSKTADALSLQIAVNLLNSVLENDGVTVDGIENTQTSHSSYAAISKLNADLKAGQIDVLIVYNTNPAYTLPRSLDFEGAIKKAGLVIVLSDREDEMGLLADFVLPVPHSLEDWGDSSSRKGLYSLQQPTISPLHNTRAFGDSLLIWSKGKAAGGKGLAIRSADWHEYIRNYWRENLFKASGSVASFEQFWEGVLRTGVLDFRSAQAKAQAKTTSRDFRPAALAALPRPVAPAVAAGEQGPMMLALYAKTSMSDGRHANNAWLQEMPDPISSVAWDNYVNVSPKLAKQLSLQGDDVVELAVGEERVQLPVHIQPGLRMDVVSVAIGYGRRAVGKVGNLAGVDVFPLVQVVGDRLAYSGQKVSLKKTGKFYKLASTQWHTATEDRPVVNDITLAQFRKNPAAAAHTDPHLRLEEVPTMWPAHEYKGYRWGMGIDLNSCTGCGACVIACQAENNVPVVGRDQVRVSRQMHWIRIDRYYSGSPENPDVVFQPMLCQHCENASCETVCPVVATVHDDEGLNVQVYNRCVGTRYCQNNCPYKVRRFNFFDHWKAYEGTLNLAWNPDVTVRTRGIMEKCTFCVQRIRDAKGKAKDEGGKVRDGDFQVACQQTCATNAIVFGDMNDPESRVSKMKESPQAFRVLEVLNNKPSISYMTKVRNKAESAHSSEHHA